MSLMKFYASLSRIGFVMFQPIVKNIFLFCVLNILLMLPQSMSMNMTWKIIYESACFNSCVIYIILSLKYLSIKGNTLWGRILHHVGVWFIVVLSMTNVFLSHNFGAVLHTYVIQLLAETNPNESSEFAQTYIFTWQTALLLLAYLAVMGLPYCLQHVFDKYLYERAKDGVARVAPVMLPAAVFVVIPFIYNLRWFGPSYEKNYSGCCGHMGSNPIFLLCNALWQNSEEFNQFIACADACEQVEVDSCKFTSSNIVVIVGESHIKSHSGLYGYKLPTNPRLSAMPNLYAFEDVITYVNLTAYCFKNFMTCHSTDEEGAWCDAPLFPAVFRKAGYNVVFWSNQFPDVANGGEKKWYEQNATMFDIKRIAESSFDHRNTKNYPMDEPLLNDYIAERNTIENDSDNLIIFHLMGQHGAFTERFPHDRASFGIGDYADRHDLTDSQKQEVADYDNATLYNDSIVAEIMNLFKEKDAIVIYFADHGEEAYDYGQRKGRNQDYESGAFVFHGQMDVPFYVYVTDTYIQNHADIVRTIEKSVKRPFMTDDVSHMLFELAGIHSKWYQPKRSLINENYNMHRKRMIYSRSRMKSFDYDKYCK